MFGFLKKGLGGVLEAVGSITGIDSIGGAVDALRGDKLSPEQQMELRKALMDQERALIEAAAKEVEVRSEIIGTEAASDDPYVRRARPTFLYIMYVVIAFNFVARPVFGAEPVPIPGDLYALFGAGYLGYAFLRSRDKGSVKGVSDLFRM